MYVSVYKTRKGCLRRTNIFCNDPIYRPFESVRNYYPCGQTDRNTDRQTDEFAITAADTQFSKLRLTWGYLNICTCLLVNEITTWWCSEFVHLELCSKNIKCQVYILSAPAGIRALWEFGDGDFGGPNSKTWILCDMRIAVH